MRYKRQKHNDGLTNKERWSLRHPNDKKAKERSQALVELLHELKEHTPCKDCGVQYPHYVMEFDHRDPKEKKFEILRHTSVSWETSAKEVEKCDIVCANCHCIRTWKRKQQSSS